MSHVQFGFLAVVVVFTATCLGKTLVSRGNEAESEKRPPDLGAGRRRGPAFGQPGLGGSFPAPPPKDDVMRTPVPDDGLREPPVEDSERSDVSARRMPDEGFFPGIGGIRDENERRDDADQTDLNDSEIPEIDNDVGERKEEMADYQDDGNGKGGDLPEDVSDERRKDADDRRSEKEDDREGERSEEPPERDGATTGGVSSDEEIRTTSEGFVFDNTFFSFRHVSKYFQRLERALELFFQQTMDELPLLNGTYANTTEEDVDIGGRMYRVVKSLIKNWGRNNSVYIETLSPVPDANETRGLESEKL